jgi:hypothetical protein
MIVIVAPEPAPWLAPMIELALQAGPVRVLAPWAMRAGAPGWLPGRLRGFWQRRSLIVEGLDAPVTLPGWVLGEGALRAWAGMLADRKLAARFALRAAVDWLAARWLVARSSGARGVRVVIAPSCASQHVFAAAARHGAARFLIEDLPDIRALHADLDAAARVHPGCVFLRRYRASRAVIVRQEAERALASALVVRGQHAQRERERLGLAPARILTLEPDMRAAFERPGRHDDAAASQRERVRAGTARVLLAGLAAARHGTLEALAAVRARPHLTLLVHPGEGMEPQDLLAHPQVAVASEDERRHLRGVDVVIAPAWCEAYLDEVAMAERLGVPVVATLRGAGWVTPVAAVTPGDVGALGAAVDGALAMARDADHGPSDLLRTRVRLVRERLVIALRAAATGG